MPIRDPDIDDFIARWKRAFGETLSRDQARMEAERVLNLYRAMLSPQQDFRDFTAVTTQQAVAAPPEVSQTEHEAA